MFTTVAFAAAGYGLTFCHLPQTTLCAFFFIRHLADILMLFSMTLSLPICGGGWFLLARMNVRILYQHFTTCLRLTLVRLLGHVVCRRYYNRFSGYRTAQLTAYRAPSFHKPCLYLIFFACHCAPCGLHNTTSLLAYHRLPDRYSPFSATTLPVSTFHLPP